MTIEKIDVAIFMECLFIPLWGILNITILRQVVKQLDNKGKVLLAVYMLSIVAWAYITMELLWKCYLHK